MTSITCAGLVASSPSSPRGPSAAAPTAMAGRHQFHHHRGRDASVAGGVAGNVEEVESGVRRGPGWLTLQLSQESNWITQRVNIRSKLTFLTYDHQSTVGPGAQGQRMNEYRFRFGFYLANVKVVRRWLDDLLIAAFWRTIDDVRVR